MPARDTHHEAVRQALIKDGWTITHDPFRLSWGQRDMFVDLGAERLLGAEKGEDRIAVEIKGFSNPSVVFDLQAALGQFTLYHKIMSLSHPERKLFLAVREETWKGIFSEPIGQLLLADQLVRLIVFNEATREVTRWVP